MSQQLPQFQTPNSYFLQPLHSSWHFTTVNNSATRRCTSTFRQYTFNLLSMPTLAVLEAVLDIFAVHKSELTVSDFILTLLEDSKLQTHLCTLVLVKESSTIITALSQHSHSADSVFAWANGVLKKKYIESIKELTTNKERHFNASHASAQALDGFHIEDMGLKMKALAPDLWNILHDIVENTRGSIADIIKNGIVLWMRC